MSVAEILPQPTPRPRLPAACKDAPLPVNYIEAMSVRDRPAILSASEWDAPITQGRHASFTRSHQGDCEVTRMAGPQRSSSA